jgi:hypothetical protein
MTENKDIINVDLVEIEELESKIAPDDSLQWDPILD